MTAASADQAFLYEPQYGEQGRHHSPFVGKVKQGSRLQKISGVLSFLTIPGLYPHPRTRFSCLPTFTRTKALLSSAKKILTAAYIDRSGEQTFERSRQ